MIAQNGSVKRLERSVDGQRYRAGDRVFITISARGQVAERAELLIRNGAMRRARLI